MNVSYRWLQSLAPGIEAPPSELAGRLAGLGFPVEEIKSLGRGLEEVVVARVEAVRPHANADRLRVCEVEGGAGKVQVVCGADNVVAGGWYPFAPVGASLPGGMKIGKVRLRGETSEGMLCSERELGLGPDHEGILTLTGEFTPGEPFRRALGLDDVRMSVEVTSNRPDLLSHEGVARELAPGGHAGLRLPGFQGEDAGSAERLRLMERVQDPACASGDGISVRIEAPDLCSRYLGLVVRGVRVGPSPQWLQTRLRSVGARPINNVVDATNYVLLELGQPLHAFDLDRVRGGSVIVRRAVAGETLPMLDGVERSLAPGMLAICDPGGAIALAGVMGGEDSEVTEETSDVLLECAHFTPGPIRATRKALGLSTDASYRFERGVDPEGLVRALLRTAQLIQTVAGGAVAGPIVDCNPRPFSRKRIAVRRNRIEKVLGIPFALDDVVGLLEPLGFDVKPEARDGEDEVLQVNVPGFRSYDVTREVDFVEEVARTHGFDRFPDELGSFRPGTVPDHPLFRLEARLRDALTAWGALEAQTPAFASAAEGEVEILNPVSAEEGFMRNRLLPGLIRRLEHNLARGNRHVRLFELGTVFFARGEGELPREETRLAVVLHGDRLPSHWSGGGGTIDLWDLKGLTERVADLIPGGTRVVPGVGADEPGTAPAATDPEAAVMDPDAAFVVLSAEGSPIGTGGRLRAGGADLPPWAGEVFVLEITLPQEPVADPTVTYAPIPFHPGVERDLALLVPAELPVGDVLAAVMATGGDMLRDVRVFDVYRDQGMAAGTRSVAIRLHFRALDRTLTDQEVDGEVGIILKTLKEALGVAFRGSRG